MRLLKKFTLNLKGIVSGKGKDMGRECRGGKVSEIYQNAVYAWIKSLHNDK